MRYYIEVIRSATRQRNEMTTAANFIAECKVSIAKHEANILAAIDAGNHSTAEKLNSYRTALLALIAKTDAAA